MKNQLAERAVLMRLTISLPGETRQDPGLTSEVVREHNLGTQAGKWLKKLYPPEALDKIKRLDNEARAYHASVTLPYDTGIGILPAALICEHGDRMRQYMGEREVLRDEFLSQPERWIDWAITQHNGTFDPDQYPGCRKLEPGEVTPDAVESVLLGRDYVLDKAEWTRKMRKKFDFEAIPNPVPCSDHFTSTVSSLLGVDTGSVDNRVAEVAMEAQRELLRRLLAPVAAMAAKLAEQPKVGKDGKAAEDIIFRDSLVGNLQDIARIAPALNLGADATIDGFIAGIEELAKVEPDKLREDKGIRADVQAKADALAKKMADYQF